jgi:hypothetical protein
MPRNTDHSLSGPHDAEHVVRPHPTYAAALVAQGRSGQALLDPLAQGRDVRSQVVAKILLPETPLEPNDPRVHLGQLLFLSRWVGCADELVGPHG